MLGAEIIPFSDEVRSLGLIIDSQLTWKAHIDKIYRETFSTLFMLRQTSFMTPKNTRKFLVKSLIIPKLTYCSSVFMGCNRSCWSKLSIIFNACTRYVCDIGKYKSVSGHTSEILGCSLENYFHYRACLFMFILLKTKAPLYLYNELVFPRKQRNRTLGFPSSMKTKQFTSTLSVMGSRLWNSLGSEIRTLDSTVKFKAQCFAHFSSN